MLKLTTTTISKAPVIGRGGGGEVRRVVPKTGKPIAVKVLQKASTRRSAAKKEYELMKTAYKLCPENTVRVYEFQETKDAYLITMELLDGYEKLNEWSSARPLSEEVKVVCKTLNEVVEKLHKNKLYHRDIKPDNVMVHSKSNNVKLTDFGLSCAEPECIEVGGTWLYMHPRLLDRYVYNQETGDYIVNFRGQTTKDIVNDDLWALGMTVLTALDRGTHPLVPEGLFLPGLQAIYLNRSVRKCVSAMIGGWNDRVKEVIGRDTLKWS